jgi:hypothetical protein
MIAGCRCVANLLLYVSSAKTNPTPYGHGLEPETQKRKPNPKKKPFKSRFESYSKYLVVLYSFVGLLLLLP